MPRVDFEEYQRLASTRVVPHAVSEEEPPEWDYGTPDPVETRTPEELEEMLDQVQNVYPSTFVEFAIKVPDKENNTLTAFSFKERPYLRAIYDSPAKKLLLKCARQVEKSTLLGNRALAMSCLVSSFNTLYVSPSNAQTKTWSNDRLKEPMETSETLRSWTSTKLSDSVFEKRFLNRSKITLRYAYHNADRTRGNPADQVLIDEIQDILTDNIPVIEQCAAHSPEKFRLFLYAGTPKTLDNPLEKYWSEQSTQNEWAIPCERHGTPGDPGSWHWNILGEEHIGPEGPVCDKCRHPILPAHPLAQWVSLCPSVRQRLESPFEAFRIPQLMVPWIGWGAILDDQRTYSRAQFYNAVLGLSIDSGERPLSQADVRENCRESLVMDAECLRRIRDAMGNSAGCFMGIDWGSGEAHSHTVVSIGAYIDGFFTIFYIHRFEGAESDTAVMMELIDRLIIYWKPELVGVDFGGGKFPNDHLIRRFGRRRIVRYQYSQPSVKIRWDEGLDRFLVHRTEVMSDIFSCIKRRNVFRFPRWSQFEDPFGRDFLNIFSEFSLQQNALQYKRSPSVSDDSFHSVLLCFLASLIRHPRPDIMRPDMRTASYSPENG